MLGTALCFRPSHPLVCTHAPWPELERQILHKFGVDREFIILTAVVIQLRALGPSWLVISDEDKENIKHLCLICIPVCEVTIMLFDNLAFVKYNLNIC